jgi:hypothetical protein
MSENDSNTEDTTPATELPVTGGETQPPGTERKAGTDAAKLTAPEPNSFNGDAQGEFSADETEGVSSHGEEVVAGDGDDSDEKSKPAKKTAAKKSGGSS